jgi:DNA-binding NtrC family response regulator
VTVCPDTRSAMETMQRATFDAAILDLKMEHDTSGLQVLAALKQVSPDTEAVIMTGYASQETTVTALRLGAFDYLTKPCKLADIEGLLLRIVEKKKLSNHAAALHTRVVAAEGSGLLVGVSPAMIPVQQFVKTVAPTDATVLITGETGTGKEIVARAIFMTSHRATMPFVPVNCGAVAQNLAESELFGHRKGSFTGADKDRKGMFEVANGGTLFLDELGELDKNTQVKMLRFLESGEIRRLGDTEATTSDVRVICATNRELRKEIAEGRFREDLLFRLNTFHIHLPQLRDRFEDIPELARHLLARHAKRPVQSVAPLLTHDALDVMSRYYWPGNVRELSNAMEYAWIVSGGHPITPQHLPHDVRTGRPAPTTTPTPTAYVPAAQPTPAVSTLPFGTTPAISPNAAGATNRNKTLEDVEMEYILQVYAKNNRNKQATAAELGISLKTLYNKLNKYEEDQNRRAG